MYVVIFMCFPLYINEVLFANGLESRVEAQTHELTSGNISGMSFLKMNVGILSFLFCIFIKVLVTLFYIGSTETRDVLNTNGTW